MGVFLVLLHICLEIYHQVAFRLYGIDLVDGSRYVKFDRYKLSKLTFLQKVNCTYCAYANGLLAYAVKIGSETEKYWCGIKHDIKKDSKYIEPRYHKDFAEYKKYK